MIELKINGIRYGGWKTASASRTLNSFASTFELTVSGRTIGSKKDLPLDGLAKIYVDGILVITGYLDEVRPRYDANKHEVVFSGRSKTCDLVDCSAIFETGQIINGTAKEIIQKIIAPFDIELVYQADSNPTIPDFQLQQGETAACAIERICNISQLVYTDDAEGRLVIAKIGSGKSSAKLIHNVSYPEQNNILSCDCTYSHRDIFSEYIVKSQTAGTDFISGEDISGIEGRISDADVKRYRPLVLLAESAMDSDASQKRAIWERANRRGRIIELAYTVYGWHTGSGKLWEPNSYINIEDDFAALSGKMLISSVNFRAGSGTTTVLSVAPPEAFIPSTANKLIKSFTGWKELKEGVKIER